MTLLGRIAVGALALGLFPASQAAADEPRFNWSGVTFGVHGGAVQAEMNARDEHGGYFTTGSGDRFRFAGQSASLGAQLGYQTQIGRWVIGNELSVSWARLEQKRLSPYFPASDDEAAKIQPILAFSSKIGYAFGRTLPYVRIGYAGADVDFVAQDQVGGVGYKQSEWHNGYVLGAGLETALGQRLVLGAEYNFTNLGSKSHTGMNTIGGTEIYQTNATVHALTARLNVLIGDRREAYEPLK